MKTHWIVIALVLSLETTPVFGLELKNPENAAAALRMELEVLPSPPRDFEQYVQELAAAARKDANDANAKHGEDTTKTQKPKTLNPLVLFRW